MFSSSRGDHMPVIQGSGNSSQVKDGHSSTKNVSAHWIRSDYDKTDVDGRVEN